MLLTRKEGRRKACGGLGGDFRGLPGFESAFPLAEAPGVEHVHPNQLK